MKLLMTQEEVEKDPERWLELRRKGTLEGPYPVGASEIASILRVQGAYSTPLAVYWDKVRGLEIPPTMAMELGSYLEEFVARKFAAMRPDLGIEPGGMYASDERPWQFATFDRLAIRQRDGLVLETIPVQIKTSHTYEGYGDDGSDNVPPHYLAQLIWEMSVGRFTEIYMPVLFLNTGQIRVYRVPWDAEVAADFDVMLAEALKFRARLRCSDPPPASPSLRDRNALVRVFCDPAPGATVTVTEHFARALRRAAKAKVATEQRAAQLENELRMTMGNATTAVTRRGEVIATRKISPVKGHWRKPGTRDALYIRKSPRDAIQD